MPELEFGLEEIGLQPVHRIWVEAVLEQRLCGRAGHHDPGPQTVVRGVLVLLLNRGVGQAGVDQRHRWGAMTEHSYDRLEAGATLGELGEAISDALDRRCPRHSCRPAWRLCLLAEHSNAGRRRGPLASLPEVDSPAIEVARRAGELMGQRWRENRRGLAASTGPSPGAHALGPRPAEPSEAAAWLTAATAVAGYRERYGMSEHTQMLGLRRTGIRPDAQAAWDHACLQADRYLVRRLRHLDEHELAELDVRQQTIIAGRPAFDPNELDEAQRALDAADRAWRMSLGAAQQEAHAVRGHARRRVQKLERLAEVHHHWRRDAAQAMATRRQIALERRRRQPHNGSHGRHPSRSIASSKTRQAANRPRRELNSRRPLSARPPVRYKGDGGNSSRTGRQGMLRTAGPCQCRRRNAVKGS